MQWLNQPGISGDANVGTELGLAPARWTEEPAESLVLLGHLTGHRSPALKLATYTVAAQDFGHWLACRVTAVGSDGGRITAVLLAIIAG
jgi:hypothetical protein